MKVRAWFIEVYMQSVDFKKRFLTYELGLLSLKGALSTRDKNYPIYSQEARYDYQRSKVKKHLRQFLSIIESKYNEGTIVGDEHIRFILDSSNNLSAELAPYLSNGRFRVGVTQKLINLHLKYLWVAGLCPEPPHCPIDGIVRDSSGITYDWIQSDSIEDYIQAISQLNKIAISKGFSLSRWELESFRRRGDKQLSG